MAEIVFPLYMLGSVCFFLGSLISFLSQKGLL